MHWYHIVSRMRGYFTACMAFMFSIFLLAHGMRIMPETWIPTVATTDNVTGERVVILDAGHGGEDCGAVGLNGCFEKDINFQMVKFLASYLRASGVFVVETRTEDKLLYDPDVVEYGHRKSTDLANRVAITKRYQNAVLVSIHMNSFPSERYSGLQVWYGSGNEESERFAEQIQTTVRETLQQENQRKTKSSNGSIYLLDYAECPGVLVECGFLTNRTECEKLSNEDYQKELSFVLFCAIINYLNVEEQGKI